MALHKEITTPTGYTASYHLISDVSISFKQRRCEVLVLGFKDAATRLQEGSQPLWGKRFQWQGNRFAFDNGPEAEPLWSQIYTALKALKEFEGAEDA